MMHGQPGIGHRAAVGENGRPHAVEAPGQETQMRRFAVKEGSDIDAKMSRDYGIKIAHGKSSLYVASRDNY